MAPRKKRNHIRMDGEEAATTTKEKDKSGGNRSCEIDPRGIKSPFFKKPLLCREEKRETKGHSKNFRSEIASSSCGSELAMGNL